MCRLTAFSLVLSKPFEIHESALFFLSLIYYTDAHVSKSLIHLRSEGKLVTSPESDGLGGGETHDCLQAG